MGRRGGSADLPLHGDRVPRWLASRMAALGCVLTEALVLEFGPHEVLRRLGDPSWFQSMGAELAGSFFLVIQALYSLPHS